MLVNFVVNILDVKFEILDNIWFWTWLHWYAL